MHATVPRWGVAGGSKDVDVYQRMVIKYARKGYVTINAECRLILIQGTDDRLVRTELTDDYVEKMKGAEIEYLMIDGVGQGVAYYEKLDITEPPIAAFFAKHLKPE